MYYLSYSADGVLPVEEEEGFTSAPMAPDPAGARAALPPARDPLANSSQLGGAISIDLLIFSLVFIGCSLLFH